MLIAIKIWRHDSFNSNFEYDILSENRADIIQDMTKDIWDIVIRNCDLSIWDKLRNECRSRTYKC